jgi:hypothetical protein
MKVYAEFIEENGIEYRTKTILQFGNSWNLIGSIVMKNPGSAFPKNEISIEDWNKVAENELVSNSLQTNWFEFQPDPTMGQVERVFNGYYTGNQIELNGVIQVFNLFNIRHQKINVAKQLASQSNSMHLFPQVNVVIDSFKNKPVFLGFGWEYLNINRSFAESMFEYVKASDFMYLKRDMIDNFFYHPGYINTSYSKEVVNETLKSFSQYFLN